ncbi:MAG: chorismate mutase [Bacillus subtilis]|nr:chorismate mutase [Bacillus subtilis]
MSDITALRGQINEIDASIRQLFLQRMEIVAAIVAYKMANDLPVYDASREAEIIARNLAEIPDETYKTYYKTVLETIMSVSKDYQKTMIMRSTYETLD